MLRSELLAKRLIEDDIPETPGPPLEVPAQNNVKDMLDQMLPTETLRLGGNEMINAAGMVNLAIREYGLGYAKGKKWAVGVLSTWRLAPDMITKILDDPRTTVEADGFNAVVTIHRYDKPSRNRKRSQQPPA